MDDGHVGELVGAAHVVAGLLMEGERAAVAGQRVLVALELLEEDPEVVEVGGEGGLVGLAGRF